MKKTLLLNLFLSSSLLCLSSFAHAQESALTLGISGSLKTYAVAVEQDERGPNGARDFDILRDSEVHFKGKAKLANGMTVGGAIETLVDDGDSFGIDESYIYVSDDWGKINFGMEDGVPYLLQVEAPSADDDVDGVRQHIQPINFGVATGSVTNPNIRMDYAHKTSGKADKISYISPKFGGFQAGVSYAPDLGTPSRGLNGVSLDEQSGDIGSVYDIAARYEAALGNAKILMSAAYSHGAVEESLAGIKDRTGLSGGLAVEFKPFSVGVGYFRDNNGANNATNRTFAIGAGYEFTDQTRMGLSYMSREDDAATPLGLLTGSETDTDRYSAGVTHDYAPGVQFRGSLHHVEFDSTAVDGDGTAALIGTVISF